MWKKPGPKILVIYFQCCLAASFLVRLENNIQNHLTQFKPPPAYMLTKYVKGFYSLYVLAHTQYNIP